MTTTAMLNVHLSEPKGTKVFADFDQVFDCTNKTFFSGKLTRPQFSFSRDPRVRVAFLKDRYISTDGVKAHGIVLNSEVTRAIGDASTMALIGLSIAQLARAEFGPIGKNGKRGTPGYIDTWTRETLLWMGLRPVAGDEGDDRQLGYGLLVVVKDDGPFDLMCRAMLVDGFTIRWSEHPTVPDDTEDADPNTSPPQQPKQTRSRFQCCDCGLIALAKPSAHLLCGYNGLPLECTNKKGD